MSQAEQLAGERARAVIDMLQEDDQKDVWAFMQAESDRRYKQGHHHGALKDLAWSAFVISMVGGSIVAVGLYMGLTSDIRAERQQLTERVELVEARCVDAIVCECAP